MVIRDGRVGGNGEVGAEAIVAGQESDSGLAMGEKIGVSV
jgi:hypothetical protein